MNTLPMFKRTLLAVSILSLSGCATYDLKQTEQQNQIVLQQVSATQVQPEIALTAEQVEQNAEKTAQLLSQPLTDTSVVELLFVNSPLLQKLMAQSWAQGSQAAQTGRIANPSFSFERVTVGHELELGRIISFGLLDLLTLPSRQNSAEFAVQQVQADLSAQLVQQVTEALKLWIDAVLANEKLSYAQKVFTAAEAAAELAQRMQKTGNFTRLQTIRQQLFYSDAAINLSNAKHQALASREALIRILGLKDAQSKQLQLLDVLPTIPDAPIAATSVSDLGAERLDIKIAQLNLQRLLARAGIDKAYSFSDVEGAIRRDTVFDNDTGERSSPKGWEVDIKLPIFDWGDLKRNAINAEILAAEQQLLAVTRAANSHLRESYSAYRTSFDIAKHYQDEVLPMQQIISEENVYRYNGMFIGVFELLADARAQVQAYEMAMDAKANFWKANASLSANLIGQPMSSNLPMSSGSSAASTGGDGH